MSITPNGAAERAGVLAAGQHGLVTAAQLQAIGVPRRTRENWLRRGVLLRAARRVYVFAHHTRTVEQTLLAAILFAGPGAMLSHVTATWWYGLLDFPAALRVVQVSTPRQIQGPAGIQVFSRRHLDRRLHRGLPVTTVTQTVLDLAAVADSRLLRRALANLDYRGMLDVEALNALCGRGISGSAHLRWALREHQPLLARANGRLEEDFLAWCERFQVPLPRVNVRVHGVLVDAYWPAARLVVELDGVANHSSLAQLRRDKRNELTLREHGLVVVRYDWALLHREPARMYRDLTSHLRRTL